MSNMINSLLETANPYTSLQKDAARLAGKWAKSGLLEGISNETDKSNMAIILENQAKQLLDEATRTGTSAGSEEWAGVALPLVRRIFGSIAAKEFVSVQPMNLPSGLIFYMDFKYGGANGKDINRPASGSSLYGGTGSVGLDNLDSSTYKLGSTQNTDGGLYGAGRFGYTINDTRAAKDASLASASLADISFDLSNSTISASYAAGKMKKFTVALPTDADFNAVRAFDFIQSGS